MNEQKHNTYQHTFKSINCFCRSFIFLILYFISTWSAAETNHPNVTLNNNNTTFSVSSLEFLSVKNKYSIEEIIHQDHDEQWIAISKNQRPFAKKGEVSSWFRFDIQPSESFFNDSNWLLVFGWTIIGEIQVHTVNQKTHEIISSARVGSRFNFSYQHTKAQNIVFPLNLSNKNLVTVYFEMPFTRSLLPPISIIEENTFLIQDRKDYIVVGIVFGSLFIMLLYNLSLSILLRNKTYFYYSCYVITVCLYLLPLKGLAFYKLFDTLPYLKTYGYSIAACLSFVSAALFFSSFLDLKKRSGWMYYITHIAVFNWIVLLIPTLFLNPSILNNVISIAAILTCLGAVIIAIKLALEKNIMAIIFLVAWSFVLFGTVVLILMNFGMVPNNSFTSNLQMFGVVFEMTLLSFALALRINTEKTKRITAQHEALQLAQRVSEERRDRLLAQKETLQLQQDLNSNLENQVVIRTEQLEDAMEQLEVANSELLTLSITDSLTGIYNRRYFDEAMLREWKRAHRNKTSIAVVITDIDHFKPINDTFGHTVGDECIHLIAKTLKLSLRRPSDLLARYGGEEFIYILPGSDLKEAEKVAENCRESIEKIQFNHKETPVPLSISAGVAACIPNDENDFSDLINAADAALYQAKSAGRNCVRTTEPQKSSI